MRKTIILTLIACLTGTTSICAQSPTDKQEIGIFNHLDLAVTLGTTGVGFDLASPLGDAVQVRAGFAIMPKFHHKMDFDLMLGDGKNNSMTTSNFEKLTGILKELTGNEVDEKVDMIGEPDFYNFKLLFDFFPLKNKHWHLTTGFYLGPSRIAKAYNTTEEMLSLVSVSMYNQMYEKAANDLPVITMGDFAIYMPKLLDYGRMGIRLGEHVTDGSLYRIEPDNNCMIKADMKVNNFRPYLGFGYGNSHASNHSKYSFSFDCGLMFWGGAPDITTHDGTNLAKDIRNIPGKVGRYVDISQKFKAYPIISFRVARKLF